MTINVQWRSLSALSEQTLEEYRALLSPEERARNTFYRRTEDQCLDVVARATLRLSLAQLTGDSPTEFRFVRSDDGPPALAGPNAGNVHFSITKTHDLIGVAISRAGPLGLDVEWLGRKNDIVSVARRWFAPHEIEDITTRPPNEAHQRFLEYWTLKEAWLKACGLGVPADLSQAVFMMQGDRSATVLGNDAWRLERMRPTPQHVAALAYPSGPTARASASC